MPEGPEISYMTYLFNKNFKNSTLKHIHILGGRYSRHNHPLNLDNLNKSLPSKIEQLSNKGKFIYLKLKDNYIVGIKLNYAHLVDHDGKHSNIQFETSKGSFYIEDLRNFGTITILNNEELNKTLQKIGPDLIHTKVSFKEYEEVMNKHPKMKIGQFLIEQKYFSGVGNYIRAEVCYEAKISPYKLIKNMNIEEKKELFIQLIKVINKAYKLLFKGKKYPLKVYKQKMTPSGEKVVVERLEANRNIYWVPSVQK
jgi:formamidopyrimidine-DNA glycosylase